MDYDALIDELYDVIHEYEKNMYAVSFDGTLFLQKLSDLNFAVRKDGIKGLGEDVEMEDDVRLEFDELIFRLRSLSEECQFDSVAIHLRDIREMLLKEGIDGIKP